MTSSFHVGLLAVTLALTGTFASGVSAQYACAANAEVDGSRPFDSPCPHEDDLVLPMPGKFRMVFRRIEVPGDEFWGNPARNMEFGDPEARIFEGPRLVSIAGSFPSAESENWMIVLGKYEVSVAQYAAVVGDGSVREGLGILAERSVLGTYYTEVLSESTSASAMSRLLSSPVRGLRSGELERFTRRYTDWCYADAECLAALPAFGSMPGFFRLPTEVEWEYAARRRTSLEERASLLPFDESDAAGYAFVSSATRVREGPTTIGRLRPTAHGLHDLYGNVAELVDGRFYAELGQGKPGMYVSRGESYAHALTPGSLRPSRRAEVQDYRRDDDGGIVASRNARLGMRLAIGSQTVPDLETFAELEGSYVEYRSTARLNSASGRSTRAPVLGTLEPLDDIDRLLEEYRLKTNLPDALSERVRQLTESARVNLRRTSETLASELAERTAITALEAGRNLFRARQARIGADAVSEANRERLLQRVQGYTDAFDEKLMTYVDLVQRLASYRGFARESVAELTTRSLSPRLTAAVTLVGRHVSEALASDVSRERWNEEFRTVFADDGLFRDR